MSPGELAKVKSRLHLPDHVIKFIQKRYSSLLLDEAVNINKTTRSGGPMQVPVTTTMTSNRDSKAEETECEIEEVEYVEQPSTTNNNRQQPTTMLAHSQIDLVETTELTVIKDVFVNDSASNKHLHHHHKHHDYHHHYHPDRLSPSESSSPSPSSSSYDDQPLKEVVKVDEETLYIVEKRRRVTTTNNNNNNASILTADLVGLTAGNAAAVDSEGTVDLEIRKNFELKPKQDKDSSSAAAAVAPLSTNSLNAANSGFGQIALPPACTPSLPPTPPPIIQNINSPAVAATTTAMVAAANSLSQQSGRKLTNSVKNGVKKMLEDLKLSIEEFNKYFQIQQQLQTQQIQTEINDYQLHFFKVSIVIENNFKIKLKKKN